MGSHQAELNFIHCSVLQFTKEVTCDFIEISTLSTNYSLKKTYISNRENFNHQRRKAIFSIKSMQDKTRDM